MSDATGNHQWALNVEVIPAEYRCERCGGGVELEDVECLGRACECSYALAGGFRVHDCDCPVHGPMPR